MDVRLQEFTQFDRADSTIYEFDNGTFVKYLTPDSSKSIRIKGNPSLTNVKTLILGIKNKHELKPFTGEIWFNELRLSDVEQIKGKAKLVGLTFICPYCEKPSEEMISLEKRGENK